MDTITIKTNGRARELVNYLSLPLKAREQFDYLPQRGTCEPEPDEWYDFRFFQYRGSWYDVYEFERIAVSPDSPLAAWYGCQTESVFSAVLIRYPFEWGIIDYGSVIVGYAHW